MQRPPPRRTLQNPPFQSFHLDRRRTSSESFFLHRGGGQRWCSGMARVKLPRSLSTPHPSPSLLRLSAAADAAAEDNSVRAGIGIGAAHSRRSSFSYYRLPVPLIRLCILKLDGSSFDVQVPKDACVLELKVKIEDIFARPSIEEGGDISWSHVWGHFCLCYNHYKLLDDKETLMILGIRDGDELCFIRHLSLNYKPIKRRSRSLSSDIHLHTMPWSGPKVIEEVAETNKDENSYHKNSSQYVDEGSNHSNNQDDDVSVRKHKEFKLHRLFRRWFSYSKLDNSQRGKSKSNVHLRFKRNKSGSKEMPAGN